MNWVKKLGYVVPASNALFEFEVQRMLPAGVSAHYTRAPHHPDRATRLEGMVRAIPALAGDLGASTVAAIGFACTTASFSDPSFEPRALDAVKTHGRCPATTATTAVVAALETLKAKRLSVISPYPDAYNDLLVKYLSGRGFEVLNMSSLYSEDAESIAPEAVAQFVKKNFVAGSDAAFISCTKLRSLEVIETLERELSRPVISSISACHWHTMRLAGLSDVMPAGRLFRLEPVSPVSAPRELAAAMSA